MNEYQLIIEQAKALLESESDAIANAANLSSLMYHNVDNLNWAGFYLFKHDQLVLGPFCGQVACTRIDIGKGVCGTAYAKKQTLLVKDVHQFEGHIACDAASESEIVVPFYGQKISGVLDVDSPIKARFGSQEKALFETLASLYSDSANGQD